MGFYDPNRRTPDWASGISEGVGNFMQMEQMKKLMALLAQQQQGKQQLPEPPPPPPPPPPDRIGIDQTALPANRFGASMPGGPSTGASLMNMNPATMNNPTYPGIGRPPMGGGMSAAGMGGGTPGAMGQGIMGGGSVGSAPGMGGIPAGLSPDLIKKILMAIMMKQGGGGMPGMPTR